MTQQYRTRKEAYLHILAEAEAGNLGAEVAAGGGCVYEDRKGRHCGVGCLFNPAQIADIKKRRLNSSIIAVVADEIGIDNIETVTGLKLIELEEIQDLHDDGLMFLDPEVLRSPENKFYRYIVDKVANS